MENPCARGYTHVHKTLILVHISVRLAIATRTYTLYKYASRSSHSWLSKQPQLVQSSKLLVASPSCAMLNKAQPQLVYFSIFFFNFLIPVQELKLLFLIVLPKNYDIIPSCKIYLNTVIQEEYKMIQKCKIENIVCL